MRILLVNPSLSSPSMQGIISTQYPLNLAYLGAYLESKGHSVHLADFNIERLGDAQFKEMLLRVSPQVAGITAMTATFNNACRIAAKIKSVLPEIKIVAGGSHVTALPQETLNMCKAIDCVVAGEGEEVFAEICGRLEEDKAFEGIQGIAYRNCSGIKQEPPREPINNLDILPFPKRDYVEIKKYKRSHVSRGISRKYLNIAEMILSRGCPGKCIFCATNVIWQNKVRFRSVENILREIEQCMKEFGANHFSFEDDSFSCNKDWTELLCAEFKRLKITWNCNLRADMVTQDLLRLMKESGCIKVQFGIESGSQRILDLMQKNISLEKIKKSIEWAYRAKIKFIEGSFILGAHPEEKLEDVLSTAGLIKQLKINLLMVSLACPFPGTKLYELMKRDSPGRDIKWKDFVFYGKNPILITKYLSKEKLVQLQRKMYLDFYLRPGLMWSTWNNARTPGEKYYWISSGINFLSSIFTVR